jgi:hypothetical protein
MEIKGGGVLRGARASLKAGGARIAGQIRFFSTRAKSTFNYAFENSIWRASQSRASALIELIAGPAWSGPGWHGPSDIAGGRGVRGSNDGDDPRDLRTCPQES